MLTSVMEAFLIPFVAWILCGILLPAWLLVHGLGYECSVQISPPNSSEETGIRRSFLYPKTLIRQPHPSISTLYDLLKFASTLYPSQPCMGARPVIRVIQESKTVKKKVEGEEKSEIKIWKYFELGAYDWWTYSRVVLTTTRLGNGLKFLGLEPRDKVTLFASTSRYWMTMAHACFTQNLIVTTAYDTLGEKGLAFSVNEVESSTLFTQADLLPIIKNILSICTTVKNVIYAPSMTGLNVEETQRLVREIQEAFPNLKLYSFQELEDLGIDHPAEPSPPTSDDLACIMYTSGSTGHPKGVMLSHGNIVAGIAGASQAIPSKPGKSVMLAYLPLAHVLEFLLENFCLYSGIRLGYGTVRTLTDTSVRHCHGDIRELGPTLLVGVPAVWETIRKGVLSKIHSASKGRRRMFDLAYQLKSTMLSLGLPRWVYAPLDELVFDKIKEQTGGNLELLISGGAPIPKDSQQFLTTCIATMAQGYGLTETVGCLAGQVPGYQFKMGSVGPPVPNSEVKLVAVPNTDYHPSRLQGEVWVRGPSIMKGYYNRPDLTAEVMHGDWFMTGDIGEWQPDGSLCIIDRKKNLVKLSHGEYIALEKLESLYKTSLLVSNLCVIADSLYSFPVAIVCPVEKSLVTLVPGKESLSFEELVKDPRVKSAALREILAAGKAGGLKGAELLGGIELVTDEWTSVNGFLTAAQKIKRQEMTKRYASQIDSLYKR